MDNRFGDYEKVEEAKYHTGGAEEPLELETGDLPESYGETRVVLLAVDPFLIHAYWEVEPGKLEEAQAWLGDDFQKARAALRFHDVTRSEAGGWFDVEIDLRTRSWYVHLWSPERVYYADLGFRAEDGRFLALARSNRVETPRSTPHPEMPVAAPPEPVEGPPGEPPPAASDQPIAETSVRATARGAGSQPAAPALKPAPEPTAIPETLDILRATFADLAPFPREQESPRVREDASSGSVGQTIVFCGLPGPAARSGMADDEKRSSAPQGLAPGVNMDIPTATFASIPATQETRADLTGRTETKFTPGVSSPLAGPPRP